MSLTATSQSLNILDLGVADYRDALKLQLELVEKRKAQQIPDTILIVEHFPVITLGARDSANALLISKQELSQIGIDLIKVRRGGGTTAHNPGQIIIYPIINLRNLNLGINEYIRKLETITVELFEKLNIEVRQQKGYPGLWIDNRKIASIGVRVSKGVTYHGLAINILNDLSIFDHIIACGLEGIEMTSALKETGRQYSISKIKKLLSTLIKDHFNITKNESR